VENHIWPYYRSTVPYAVDQQTVKLSDPFSGRADAVGILVVQPEKQTDHRGNITAA
jgi:hypothetical protein